MDHTRSIVAYSDVAFAVGGPAALGAVLGLQLGPVFVVREAALLPLLTCGLAVAMMPALYIGLNLMATAPPPRAVITSVLRGLRAGGILLLGLAAPSAFLLGTTQSRWLVSWLGAAVLAAAMTAGLRVIHADLFGGAPLDRPKFQTAAVRGLGARDGDHRREVVLWHGRWLTERRDVMTTTTTTAGAAGNLAFTTIDALLRDHSAILARIQAGSRLAELARTMLLTIVVSCAVFGGAIGVYRGGVQILYGAVKLPLLMLLTAAVCTPVLSAVNAALDRPSHLRRDLALMLASMALGSLVLLAQAPLVLLAICVDATYHQVILVIVGCSALAGVASLVLLVRGIGSAHAVRADLAAVALLIVVAIVGAQMAWTLRPYAVRPRTPDTPFVRNLEGSLVEAIFQSSASARGNYSRESAPLPGASRSGGNR